MVPAPSSSPTAPLTYPLSALSTFPSLSPSIHLSAHQLDSLYTHSTAAKSRAYCPYSHFRVGCAILTHDDRYIVGANVENASYPVGTCAERVALATAVVDGLRRGELLALAVATDSTSLPASPCGMCRQFIREFCELETPIFMFAQNGNFIVLRLEQLLPLSFGPENLVPPPGRDATGMGTESVQRSGGSSIQ